MSRALSFPNQVVGLRSGVTTQRKSAPLEALAGTSSPTGPGARLPGSFWRARAIFKSRACNGAPKPFAGFPVQEKSRASFNRFTSNRACQPALVQQCVESPSSFPMTSILCADARTAREESEMFDKVSENQKKVALTDAQKLIVKIAGRYGSSKEQIMRAYTKLSAFMTYNRVRDLFYAAERVRVGADELDVLRRVARVVEEESVSNEYRLLLDRLARLEAAMVQIDPDFHCETIDTLRGIRREACDLDRPLAQAQGGA